MAGSSTRRQRPQESAKYGFIEVWRNDYSQTSWNQHLQRQGIIRLLWDDGHFNELLGKEHEINDLQKHCT